MEDAEEEYANLPAGKLNTFSNVDDEVEYEVYKETHYVPAGRQRKFSSIDDQSDGDDELSDTEVAKLLIVTQKRKTDRERHEGYVIMKL